MQSDRDDPQVRHRYRETHMKAESTDRHKVPTPQRILISLTGLQSNQSFHFIIANLISSCAPAVTLITVELCHD